MREKLNSSATCGFEGWFGCTFRDHLWLAEELPNNGTWHRAVSTTIIIESGMTQYSSHKNEESSLLLLTCYFSAGFLLKAAVLSPCHSHDR